MLFPLIWTALEEEGIKTAQLWKRQLALTQKSAWKLDCSWAAFSSRFSLLKHLKIDTSHLYIGGKTHRLLICREAYAEVQVYFAIFFLLIFQLASSFTALVIFPLHNCSVVPSLHTISNWHWLEWSFSNLVARWNDLEIYLNLYLSAPQTSSIMTSRVP